MKDWIKQRNVVLMNTPRVHVHKFKIQGRKLVTVGNRSAYTLVEVIISTLIVGLVMVGAMQNVGASLSGQEFNLQRSRAVLMAMAMMAEIRELPYLEPDDTPTFGREAGESATSRVNYDDVDDYDGWNCSPPEEKDGSAISNADGFSRAVTVEYVDPDDLTATVGGDQSVKRITVSVVRRGETLASMTTITADVRTNP